MPFVWPGVCSVRDLEVADARRSRPGPSSPVTPSTRSSGWASTCRSGQRSVSLRQLLDVVVVVVGEQDVGRRHVVALGRRDERRAPARRRRRRSPRRRARRRGRCSTGTGGAWSVRGSWSADIGRWPAQLGCGHARAHPHLLPHRRHRPLRRLLRGARLRGGAAACRSATRRSTSSWACPDDGARLELTYNHGVDSYELGTGYNHIAITAADLDAHARQAWPSRASSPRSRPTPCARAARGICFVRDPDGYRIEIIETLTALSAGRRRD